MFQNEFRRTFYITWCLQPYFLYYSFLYVNMMTSPQKRLGNSPFLHRNHFMGSMFIVREIAGRLQKENKENLRSYNKGSLNVLQHRYNDQNTKK